MEPAYVGLGGNLGDVPARLRWAACELAWLPGVEAVRLSSLYLTAPVGPEADQPWFVNAVVELRGSLPPPLELLDALQEIERRGGRDRSRETRMGPRPIDLDLLLQGARVLDDERLTLPHPRLSERAFGLAPLVELCGEDLVIPGHGHAGDLLARALASQSIVRI